MREVHRKNIRLDQWDYASDAAYFVTICCPEGRKLFGEIVDEHGTPLCELPSIENTSIAGCRLSPSRAGECCERVIAAAYNTSKQVHVSHHVVMPNHIHLIIVARQSEGAPTSLSSFVHYLKGAVTREVRKIHPGAVVWQKGYYEHVIRDEADYQRILEYVTTNPLKWANDKYYR